MLGIVLQRNVRETTTRRGEAGVEKKQKNETITFMIFSILFCSILTTATRCLRRAQQLAHGMGTHGEGGGFPIAWTGIYRVISWLVGRQAGMGWDGIAWHGICSAEKPLRLGRAMKGQKKEWGEGQK